MFSRLPMSLAIIAALACSALSGSAGAVDLRQATVVVQTQHPVVATAATVLVEEIQKRTGLTWPTQSSAPESGTAIVLSVQSANGGLPEEGFRVSIDPSGPRVEIIGADPRGVLFGVGHVLRKSEWHKGQVTLPKSAAITTSPEYPIRGHQLGYRDRANTYDKWDVATYDQYIRELAIFGANCVENIPSEGGVESDHMVIGRFEMNTAMSEICAKYGLDFWMWIPATFDLTDPELRAAGLAEHEMIYSTTPQVDDIFFPGGDPGNNHPRDVMPYLEDVAEILHKHHPEAMIWLSMQGFGREEVDYVYDWIEKHDPKSWLAGLVMGPSSPPMGETRARLPQHFQLRHYPDITHTVRCQYEVPWWDPAYARTHTREPVNVQPVYQQFIHNTLAPHTDGFLAYSDGSHDDVHKAVWSQLGWDTTTELAAIVEDYARFFLNAEESTLLAGGLFAFEKNWEGPVATNGSVVATQALWNAYEERHSAGTGADANWRQQMFVLRANLDAYTRARLLNDRQLEKQANAAVLAHLDQGADAAIAAGLAELAKSDTPPAEIAELRTRIVALCEALWESIGFQTSVPKYNANAGHRAAILDYIDLPLNNRWWLEDEFAKVKELPDEERRAARLKVLATWENPAPGSFYDDIGNIGASPNYVFPGGRNTHASELLRPTPTFWAQQGGFSRARQAWTATLGMSHPNTMRYEDLDPNATYTLRMTGMGDAKPRAGGTALQPTRYGKADGDIKEFPVPQAATNEGRLEITFDPIFEPGVNWREASRISEIWLIPNR